MQGPHKTGALNTSTRASGLVTVSQLLVLTSSTIAHECSVVRCKAWTLPQTGYSASVWLRQSSVHSVRSMCHTCCVHSHVLSAAQVRQPGLLRRSAPHGGCRPWQRLYQRLVRAWADTSKDITAASQCTVQVQPCSTLHSRRHYLALTLRHQLHSSRCPPLRTPAWACRRAAPQVSRWDAVLPARRCR